MLGSKGQRVDQRRGRAKRAPIFRTAVTGRVRHTWTAIAFLVLPAVGLLVTTGHSLASGGPVPGCIDGNDGLSSSPFVTGGSGTPDDPYVIEGWNLTLDGEKDIGICIVNTDVPFVVRDVRIEGTGASETYGAFLGNVSNARVESSLIRGVQIAVLLEMTKNLTISGNSLLESGVSGVRCNYPIYCGDRELSILDNEISGGGWLGAIFLRGYAITISGNRVGDGEVIIDSSEEVVIRGNLLKHADISMGMGSRRPRNITIADNEITEGRDGVNVMYGLNLLIETNRIVSNWRNGIYVESSENVTVTDNALLRNGIGTVLENGETGRVVRNRFEENGVGVDSSTSVAIAVHHNHFFRNGVQALGGTDYFHTWDDGYPSGGNCWSDYGGEDWYRGPNQDQPGGDGIGDVSYEIPPVGRGVFDRYPLYDGCEFYAEVGARPAPVHTWNLSAERRRELSDPVPSVGDAGFHPVTSPIVLSPPGQVVIPSRVPFAEPRIAWARI